MRRTTTAAGSTGTRYFIPRRSLLFDRLHVLAHNRLMATKYCSWGLNHDPLPVLFFLIFGYKPKRQAAIQNHNNGKPRTSVDGERTDGKCWTIEESMRWSVTNLDTGWQELYFSLTHPLHTAVSNNIRYTHWLSLRYVEKQLLEDPVGHRKNKLKENLGHNNIHICLYRLNKSFGLRNHK